MAVKALHADFYTRVIDEIDVLLARRVAIPRLTRLTSVWLSMVVC